MSDPQAAGDSKDGVLPLAENTGARTDNGAMDSVGHADDVNHGTSGLGVVAGPARVDAWQAHLNLPVPPLKGQESIAEWRPLFMAAISSLLCQGVEGERLAIGMLPAFVNRRPAERELVKDVIADVVTLSEAFDIIIQTLDQPASKYDSMHEMCAFKWKPGVPIDDYYLRKLAKQAQAGCGIVKMESNSHLAPVGSGDDTPLASGSDITDSQTAVSPEKNAFSETSIGATPTSSDTIKHNLVQYSPDSSESSTDTSGMARSETAGYETLPAPESDDVVPPCRSPSVGDGITPSNFHFSTETGDMGDVSAAAPGPLRPHELTAVSSVGATRGSSSQQTPVTGRTPDSDWETDHDADGDSISSDSGPDMEPLDDVNSTAEDNADRTAPTNEDVEKRVEDILKKPRPKHSWSLMKELLKRQYGCVRRPSGSSLDRFRRRQYGALHTVERLELAAKLQFHSGCVNCVSFSNDGQMLASGSDDTRVAVWDWQRRRLCYSYATGHRSNIFEAKFVPLPGDGAGAGHHIVTTSRDGQVRLADVSPAGVCRSVRRLAQHRGSGRKLVLPVDSPHCVLSCGEDALVINIDLRESQPQVIVVCREFGVGGGGEGRKVPTNCISGHPLDGNVFALACVDKYVRLYDRRMLTADRSRTVRQYCPENLQQSGSVLSVTSCAFSYDGRRLLGSYNDDDVYMFDTPVGCPDSTHALHRYSGHRNNATIKGVNFFGPHSEYVVSGSDCANIFFWDAESEAIVQCLRGDENGVVNALEPHPFIPVMATSGLDDDVKLWVPSNDHHPEQLNKLHQIVEGNIRDRLEDTPVNGLMGGNLMWSLMQQVLRSERRRNRSTHRVDTEATSSEDSDAEGPAECTTS